MHGIDSSLLKSFEFANLPFFFFFCPVLGWFYHVLLHVRAINCGNCQLSTGAINMPCQRNKRACSVKKKCSLFLNQNSKTNFILKIKTANQCSLIAYMVLVIKKEREKNSSLLISIISSTLLNMKTS